MRFFHQIKRSLQHFSHSPSPSRQVPEKLEALRLKDTGFVNVLYIKIDPAEVGNIVDSQEELKAYTFYNEMPLYSEVLSERQVVIEIKMTDRAKASLKIQSDNRQAFKVIDGQAGSLLGNLDFVTVQVPSSAGCFDPYKIDAYLAGLSQVCNDLYDSLGVK